MPFTMDLHFGYRDEAWTAEEMDTSETKEQVTEA